ncbi:uncharacterized protein G2W53_008734 [Senna tora]|uniref:Uncharacterized protein n=1 Tax=Senna tora TaxID=362788 RepID=A0A834WWZ2_9FABA|nr:uncharacterized protein G2W53_008734 [Senna tora]
MKLVALKLKLELISKRGRKESRHISKTHGSLERANTKFSPPRTKVVLACSTLDLQEDELPMVLGRWSFSTSKTRLRWWMVNRAIVSVDGRSDGASALCLIVSAASMDRSNISSV